MQPSMSLTSQAMRTTRLAAFSSWPPGYVATVSGSIFFVQPPRRVQQQRRRHQLQQDAEFSFPGAANQIRLMALSIAAIFGSTTFVWSVRLSVPPALGGASIAASMDALIYVFFIRLAINSIRFSVFM